MHAGRSEFVKTLEASIFALSLILLGLSQSSPVRSVSLLDHSMIGSQSASASTHP